MKLMTRRVVVGMNTVRMLLMIGLPRVTFTTSPPFPWIFALHIWIFLSVYWAREISLLCSKWSGFMSVNCVDPLRFIWQCWVSNGYQCRSYWQSHLTVNSLVECSLFSEPEKTCWLSFCLNVKVLLGITLCMCSMSVYSMLALLSMFTKLRKGRQIASRSFERRVLNAESIFKCL